MIVQERLHAVAIISVASSINGIKNNFFITFNLLILSMLQRYSDTR